LPVRIGLAGRAALPTAIEPLPSDWNPEAYARFRGYRLRPALDLLAQVQGVPNGPVIDLGCGDGAAGPILAQRFGAVEGVDASPAMLDTARATGAYARLTLADIADWAPDAAPALIFSNAALHWLGDHAWLFPRLARMLVPGGTLAVQMPAQNDAPSHALLRTVAARLFPGRPLPLPSPVGGLADYHGWLGGLGDLALWETTYLQLQPPAAIDHPVRAFTEATAMRPFVEGLTAAEAAAFMATYDAALHGAYPLRPDGSALFPFRRRFLTLKVP
jgi:trans-aconitate 2-methyltransferase